jgi:hypothetical protein
MTTRGPLSRQIDSWQSAETNAAEWMRFFGFHDARVTQGGSDGGIDVRSSGALAQVKYEARQVGRPQLQMLVGARGNLERALLFFTGSGYSATALAYANEMGIALFKYELTGQMVGVNRAAKSYLAATSQGGSTTAQAPPLREIQSAGAMPAGDQTRRTGGWERMRKLPMLRGSGGRSLAADSRYQRSGGDVTWFDYRASRSSVISALREIHALGGGRSINLDTANSRVTIAPDWALRYEGFVCLAAELEEVRFRGETLCRVHWVVEGKATPTTIATVTDALHEASAKGISMLSELLGEPVRSGDS